MRVLKDLSEEDLEVLDGYRLSDSFKVLRKIVDAKQHELMIQSFLADDRDIQRDNVTIHERAVEKLKYNAGFTHGMEFVLGVLELAKERQRKNSQ